MPPSITMGRRLWQHCRSAVFVLCLTPSLITSAAAQQPTPASDRAAPGVEVEIAHGLITIQADGAPLVEVLRAVGQAASFQVVLRGSFATPVRQSFIDQPLEDAIRQLVEGHSLVVLRGGPDPASGAAALVEIRVIENTALTASKGAASAAPAQAAAEAAAGDAHDDPPMDRESFRLARQGVPPPTRDDILFELDEPEPATRVAVVPKVGSLPPRDALEVVSHVFANDDDTTVLSRALAALTRLDGPSARGLLRERAFEDDDPELRMQALNALASSRGERAVNVLGQALRRDPEPEVRMGAIRALGRVGGDWARRALQRATRDFDPEISAAAEQALAAWPEPAQ